MGHGWMSANSSYSLKHKNTLLDLTMTMFEIKVIFCTKTPECFMLLTII